MSYTCLKRRFYKSLVNFESDVRLAHGPGSEAVGNVGFEAIAVPWSLKGECSFGVPFLGYLVMGERSASRGKVHVRIVNCALFIVRNRVIKDLERRKVGSFLTTLGRRKFLGSHWKRGAVNQVSICFSVFPVKSPRMGTSWWFNPGLGPIFVIMIRQHEPKEFI